MKEYIDQIFYEGLGKSIYCPIENAIEKLNNNVFKKYLILMCKVLYFILSIIIAVVLLCLKL